MMLWNMHISVTYPILDMAYLKGVSEWYLLDVKKKEPRVWGFGHLQVSTVSPMQGFIPRKIRKDNATWMSQEVSKRLVNGL